MNRGNGTIAELLRLLDFIANEFRLDNKRSIAIGNVLTDFSYFHGSELHEAKIEAKAVSATS